MSEHTHTHSHSHGVSTKEELITLLKYMVDHNASHTHELSHIAEKSELMGKEASEELQQAIKSYEEANSRLAAVLEKLGE